MYRPINYFVSDTMLVLIGNHLLIIILQWNLQQQTLPITEIKPPQFGVIAHDIVFNMYSYGLSDFLDY